MGEWARACLALISIMGIQRKKRVLFVFGTRPEAIKLAPLIRAFQSDQTLETKVCVTAQHRELLDQFLTFFEITPEADLDLMFPDQPLPALAARAIESCAEVFARSKPDLVVVQGDTTSAFAAAFSAGLCKIPVAHVEAGLRSYRKDAPFPEEINRVLISRLADLHFAHTAQAGENLRRENIVEGLHVVGNTGVDALHEALRLIAADEAAYARKFSQIDPTRPTVLVTLHRRENLGRPSADIFGALQRIAAECDVNLLYPVHPNPRVRDLAYKVLSAVTNIHLLEPLAYADFIWMLSRAALVITDSGGVLEEAETLGVPALVTREVTERTEAVASGSAVLVGSDPERIFAEVRSALARATRPSPSRALRTTFGDGLASERILQITKQYLGVLPA